MLGVLTYRGTAAPSDPRKAGIARTRWAGYSRAAGIRIPTTVDEAHIFNEMNATGTTILLFDPSGGGLKRWAPPFPPGAIEAIVRFLLAPDSRIMGKRP